MKYKINNEYIVDAKSPKEAIKRIEKFKDSKKLKDSYFIVACEQGDFWYNEMGKPDSFKNAKKFSSYEEADRWRRNKGSGSVQKVTDSIKKSEKLKDSTIVLRKDESFERQVAEKIARENNLQLRMDGVKNIFTGSEDDLYRMIYTYFRSNYADRITERIKDSIKDDLKYKVGSKLEVDYDAKNLQKWHGYEDWVIEDILNKEDKIYIISHGNLKQSISERDIDKMMSIKDSCKDEKIYEVIVKYAGDKDVSKLITEAQNIGFTTDDRGFVIYLKNGNDEMLRKLKIRVYGTGVVFNDSYRDSEIDYLTQEEEQAVEDYRKAIQSTTNPKLLEIYSHILQEETEHIRELQEAKKIDEQ